MRGAIGYCLPSRRAPPVSLSWLTGSEGDNGAFVGDTVPFCCAITADAKRKATDKKPTMLPLFVCACATLDAAISQSQGNKNKEILNSFPFLTYPNIEERKSSHRSTTLCGGGGLSLSLDR